MDVDIEFLTGSIRDELPSAEIAVPEIARRTPARDGRATRRALERVLAHRDVCSREPLYRRYDAVVRGCTVIPRGAADAGVLAPIPGSALGVALAVAGNPRYGHIDVRLAAEHAVYEAVRSVVAVGARPIGLTDCLNFGNPRKVDHYSEFVAAIDGLARAAERVPHAVRLGQREPVQRVRERQGGARLADRCAASARFDDIANGRDDAVQVAQVRCCI